MLGLCESGRVGVHVVVVMLHRGGRWRFAAANADGMGYSGHAGNVHEPVRRSVDELYGALVFACMLDLELN